MAGIRDVRADLSSIPRQAVLSHRVRGFGPPEGSLPALAQALVSRIGHVEMDTRRTADGVLLAFHDNRLEGMTTSAGRMESYHYATRGPLRFLERPDEEVPTLSAFTRFFAEHAPPDVRLHIDIKDRGSEKDHVTLIESLGLVDRVSIVAWDPDILLRIHALQPMLRLYFSYVPLTGRMALARAAGLALDGTRLTPLARRALRHVSPRFALGSGSVRIYRRLDDVGARNSAGSATSGEFPIYLMPNLPRGAVLAALRHRGGGVNIPVESLHRHLVRAIRAHGLGFGVFPLTTTYRAAAVYTRYAPDLLYLDRVETTEA